MKTAAETSGKGLVKATWIVLLLTWVMFLIHVPVFVWIGLLLNLAAFTLSLVLVTTKGSTKSGTILLLLTVASTLVLFYIELTSVHECLQDCDYYNGPHM